MRARRLVPLLILPLFAGCDCGGKVQHSSSFLAMSPKSLDFGVGCLNATKEQQIVLENQGNTAINVDQTKSKVTGLAFSLLAPLPDAIDPGQQVVVRVGFTPTTADQFSGSFQIVTDADHGGTQSGTLVGDGSDKPPVDFEVTCPLTPTDTQFQSCSFLSFDNVPAGTTMDRVARLSNLGCGPLTVNELFFYPGPNDTSSGADVQLFSTPKDKAPLVLRGGEQHDVTVRFSAPPAVALQPDVRMKLTSTDPKAKNATDPGVWDLGMFANSVAPALLVDKDRLTFFDAQTNVPDPKTFTVSNTGDAPLTVDSVTLVPDHGTTAFTLSPAGPFTLQPTGGPNDSQTVTVTYTSTHAGGDSGTVVVKAGSETAKVQLIAGTEPQLVVTWFDANNNELAPPVDFGQTATGAKGLTRIVRLSNAGTATLNVSNVTIPADSNPAGSYSVPPFTPTAIAPGAHADVTVTFNDAVSLRNDAAKLRIASDDPAYASLGGTYDVDLQSENEPNFKPVPCITVCAHQPGSTQCSTAPQLSLDLTVDGSCSTGPEAGDTLTFKWELPVKPASSTATLDTPTNIKTSIVSASGTKPDVVGNYVVKLTVTDQFNQSSSISQSMNVMR